MPPVGVQARQRKRRARGALALTLGAAIVLFVAAGGPRYFSIETVKEHADVLLAFSSEHRLAAPIAAGVAYVIAAALTLPVGGVLAIASGFLFGRWTALVVIVLAGTVGGTLALLEARYLFADAARIRLGSRARMIDAGIARNAFSYMLFVRVVPFPYVLVNLAAALSSIPLRVFVPATLIGLVPGAFVYASVGESLGQIQSTSDLLTLRTLGPLALLGVLALLPVFLARRAAQR